MHILLEMITIRERSKIETLRNLSRYSNLFHTVILEYEATRRLWYLANQEPQRLFRNGPPVSLTDGNGGSI